MNILHRIGKWLRGRESSALSFKNWLNFVGGAHLGIPSDTELETAYLTSSVVKACVEAIVDAISVLEVKVDGAPYIKLLLERPSPRGDWPQFISEITRRYLVCGASFVWKKREGAALSGLLSVPTSAVNWRADDTFALTVDGKVIPLSGADLPGMIITSIESTHSWMSPLGAAWPEIQIDSQRNTFQRTILGNLADASLVIESTAPNSPEQREDMRASIGQVTAGTDRGGILVLPPGFKATSPGKIRDMALSGIGKTVEARISAVLNVPAVIVGLEIGMENMTYSNYYEARESFYEETIEPLARGLGAFLTRALIEEEGLRGSITLERSAEARAKGEKKGEEKEENADAKTKIEKDEAA